MRISMKKILSLLLITSSIFSMDIPADPKENAFLDIAPVTNTLCNSIMHIKFPNVVASTTLNGAKLYHDNKTGNYLVEHKGRRDKILTPYVDQSVRHMNNTQLNNFVTNVGYLSLEINEGDDYILKAKRNHGHVVHTKSSLKNAAVVAAFGIVIAGGVGYVLSNPAAIVDTVTTAIDSPTITDAGNIISTAGQSATKGVLEVIERTFLPPLDYSYIPSPNPLELITYPFYLMYTYYRQ